MVFIKQETTDFLMKKNLRCYVNEKEKRFKK